MSGFKRVKKVKRKIKFGIDGSIRAIYSELKPPTPKSFMRNLALTNGDVSLF